DKADLVIAGIASAIGEPARVRMLYTLLDGHARTATELAVAAEVSASTASAHLNRLLEEHLVKVLCQGKHRYYSLRDSTVADALEGLSVLAGGAAEKFVPNTPRELREARTCYDHMAGTIGVLLCGRFLSLRWLRSGTNNGYELTTRGSKELQTFNLNIFD